MNQPNNIEHITAIFSHCHTWNVLRGQCNSIRVESELFLLHGTWTSSSSSFCHQYAWTLNLKQNNIFQVKKLQLSCPITIVFGILSGMFWAQCSREDVILVREQFPPDFLEVPFFTFWFVTPVISGTWWVFYLVIISAYTANLAAVLTVSRPYIPIKNLDDLANQTTISYGTIRGGSTMQFFQESRIAAHVKMWEYMKDKDVFVTSNGKGVERALRYCKMGKVTASENTLRVVSAWTTRIWWNPLRWNTRLNKIAIWHKSEVFWDLKDME